MNDVKDYNKGHSAESEPGVRPGSFFTGIVFNGCDRDLDNTLKSVLRQQQSSDTHIFFPADKELPLINPPVNIVGISFQNKGDFFQKLANAIEVTGAEYSTVLLSGEELFEGAFAAVDGIFKQYDKINWLTGIQAIKAQGGYNITLGSTAIRRWSLKIYERNLYKNAGRFIPPGSTFWRKRIWSAVSPNLHFVGQNDFYEDIWVAMFRTQQLYTCKLYLSSARSYDKLYQPGMKQPNSPALIEDNLFQKIKEFFFVNNIPFLRVFYRTESGFAPVVRFDHSSQAFFLSEY